MTDSTTGDTGASVDETETLTLKWSADGLIAAAATEESTGRLLMIAWMNEEAFAKTLETGQAHYWSRSRRKLWRKGETSGHVQKIQEVRIDCDQDAVELVVEQTGAACHTNRKSCFYRKATREDDGSVRLVFLE